MRTLLARLRHLLGGGAARDRAALAAVNRRMERLQEDIERLLAPPDDDGVTPAPLPAPRYTLWLELPADDTPGGKARHSYLDYPTLGEAMGRAFGQYRNNDDGLARVLYIQGEHGEHDGRAWGRDQIVEYWYSFGWVDRQEYQTIKRYTAPPAASSNGNGATNP